MKRKILLLSIGLIFLGGCRKQSDEVQVTNSKEVIVAETNEEIMTKEGEEDEKNIKTETENPKVEEEKAEVISSVELLIPDGNMDMGQDYWDSICEMNGYESITVNEDGSILYIMTEEQYAELLIEKAETCKELISSYINPETYSYVVEVEHTDDFTEFVVKVTTEKIDDADIKMIAMPLAMCSEDYALYSGRKFDKCKIDFINAESGEIIEAIDLMENTESVQ